MSLPFKKIHYIHKVLLYVIVIYYEYAINYKLSCLRIISTCILCWNPAGWNRYLRPSGTGPPISRGFTSGLFEVDVEKIFGSMRRWTAEDANRKILKSVTLQGTNISP